MNSGQRQSSSAALAATQRPWAVENAGTMLPACLYDPPAFDAFLNAPSAVDALPLMPDTPIGRVRAAQVRFAHSRPAQWLDLAEELWGLPAAPARGTRLLVLVALGMYDEVLNADPEPRGCMPLDLEDSCLAHFAIGQAATQRGMIPLALEHLRVALTLARALRLHNRAQTIGFEWHRVRNLVGQASPDELQALLMQPMTDARRGFGQRVRAEGLMSLGLYTEALISLGNADQDSPGDACLREWLHAVCALPPARETTDPLLDPVDCWWILAQALRDLEAGRPVDVRGVEGQPATAYAQLIGAEELLRLPRMAGAALALLGDTPPARPDQATIWATMRIGAALDNAAGTDLMAAHRVLEEALPRLRSSTELMGIIRRINPERTTILAMSPVGHLLDRTFLMDQSLLLGQTVTCGRHEVRLPGRTGRTVVLEAARVGIINQADLSRSERKRLEEALVGFGRVVNMGRVLRAYSLMSSAAGRAGDEARQRAWVRSRDRVIEMLSPDVQSVLTAQTMRHVG